jgi:hypothetical protein
VLKKRKEKNKKQGHALEKNIGTIEERSGRGCRRIKKERNVTLASVATIS